MPLIIPGIMLVISRLKISSTTGTMFCDTKFTNCPAAVTIFWKTPANVSKTAMPFSPKISFILFRAAPMFPSEKTLFIVCPTFVITATILSKISSPFSPKMLPTASRTLSKFFHSICTTAMIVVIIPIIGRNFPAMPPNGPSADFNKLPNGPNADFSTFPMGAINALSFPKLEAITFPIDPNGEFNILPLTFDNMSPSAPPIFLNGFSRNKNSFEPVPVRTPASFPTSPANPIDIFLAILLNKLFTF